MSRTIWMGIAPGPGATRVIAMAGARETILKSAARPGAETSSSAGDAAGGHRALAGETCPRCAGCGREGRGSDSMPLSRSRPRGRRGALHARLGARGPPGPLPVIVTFGGSATLAIFASSRSARWRDDLARAALSYPPPVLRRALEDRHHRRRVGVHRDTVALAVEPQRFTNVAFRPSVALLDPYKDFVRATLEQHPRLRATRLFEMIQGRGYPGSVWPLRRYVREVRPGARTRPSSGCRCCPASRGRSTGEASASITIGKSRRWLSCFVMALSFSRALFARFVLDQTLEAFSVATTPPSSRSKGSHAAFSTTT